MARYIDADLFKQCIQDNITRYFTCGTGGYCLAEDVVEDIDSFPTADVAPKSEVAIKICCEIEEEIVAALESNYKARTRYYTKQKYEKVDEEFINTVNGKIAALRGIEGFIAELKKKYTEEKE